MEIFIMWFFVFLASFIFGTIMGSFLNVLAPALEPVVFREKAKTSF
ncbi:MAG: prepilin peptidase [Candidatus Pacebacteria bacterium]|nr:prepilin peptidase [Candidatus Paceibacterota bacterium]